MKSSKKLPKKLIMHRNSSRSLKKLRRIHRKVARIAMLMEVAYSTRQEEAS